MYKTIIISSIFLLMASTTYAADLKQLAEQLVNKTSDATTTTSEGSMQACKGTACDTTTQRSIREGGRTIPAGQKVGPVGVDNDCDGDTECSSPALEATEQKQSEERVPENLSVPADEGEVIEPEGEIHSGPAREVSVPTDDGKTADTQDADTEKKVKEIPNRLIDTATVPVDDANRQPSVERQEQTQEETTKTESIREILPESIPRVPAPDNPEAVVIKVGEGELLTIESVIEKKEPANAPASLLVTATQEKSLFGLIPVRIAVEAEIDDDGSVTITRTPWYSFLLW